MIRVAWYDKIMNKYDSGSWHHRNNINEKMKWVEQQNKNIPNVRYWVEGMLEKNISKYYPNIETFNIIKVKNNDDTDFIFF